MPVDPSGSHDGSDGIERVVYDAETVFGPGVTADDLEFSITYSSYDSDPWYGYRWSFKAVYGARPSAEL
jgi:hypothetical protein